MLIAAVYFSNNPVYVKCEWNVPYSLEGMGEDVIRKESNYLNEQRVRKDISFEISGVASVDKEFRHQSN